MLSCYVRNGHVSRQQPMQTDGPLDGGVRYPLLPIYLPPIDGVCDQCTGRQSPLYTKYTQYSVRTMQGN